MVFLLVVTDGFCTEYHLSATEKPTYYAFVQEDQHKIQINLKYAILLVVLLAQYIGETGASCNTFQVKSLFMKSMIDALFLSTYTLISLFVLIKHTIPLIFRIVVR